MDEYRKQVRKSFKLLSVEEQHDLYSKMSNGSLSAREKLINSCLPLVWDIATKFSCNNKHICLDDFVQEGNLALIRAVDKFDPKKAKSITTLVTLCVQNALIDMVHDAKYSITTCVTFNRIISKQMKKIIACNTKDIDKIHEETKIPKKRIKKILNLKSLYESKKVSIEYDFVNLNVENQPKTEEQLTTYCLADVYEVIENNFPDAHKKVFSLWANQNTKKKKSRIKIANDLGLNVKQVNKIIQEGKKIIRKTLQCQNTT